MALHQTALWRCTKQPYGTAPNSPMALHQRALWHCHWGLPSGCVVGCRLWQQAEDQDRPGRQASSSINRNQALTWATQLRWAIRYSIGFCSGAPCVQRDMCQALLTIPNYTTHHDKLLYNKLHHLTPHHIISHHPTLHQATPHTTAHHTPQHTRAEYNVLKGVMLVTSNEYHSSCPPQHAMYLS